jgi:predicted aspartyl protease
MSVKCFTVRSTGILRVLKTLVDIGPAFDPAKSPPPFRPPGYRAIWDTGATGSVIMQKVIDDLGLKQFGVTKAFGVNGEHITQTYYVSIGLPNGVGFSSVLVTKGDVLNADVLIGMDIISSGDFALTHHEGKTCFSFRIPSVEAIDFTVTPPPGMKVDPSGQLPDPSKSIPKVGRNDPCPCGSGKKYKRCHGVGF